MAALLEPVPPPQPSPSDPLRDGGVEEVNLAEYLDILVRGRWIIVVCAALALVAGVGYTLLATPIYRADALVQVEDKKTGIAEMTELPAPYAQASPAETEMEILRSRTLVGAVVDTLQLQVTAAPRRFPLVGGAVARHYSGEGPRGALLGLGRYGWGGERIAVGRVEVPASLEGTALTLEALSGGRYTLHGPDGPLLQGAVGAPASGHGVSLFVAELVARPGTEFTVAHSPRAPVVAGLQQGLQISEKGKNTGVIQLALQGADPTRIAATLDALSHAYLRQNVERKNAEAAKTLEFLDTQLPDLKANLEKAESALEAYRAQKGSLDVTMEAQAAITRAADVEKAISELKLELVSLQQRFTGDHPALVAAREKLARLQTEQASMEGRLKQLPESELESARRLRDVKVANELYVTLLNRAQELRVVKEGTVGNVRILDSAVVPGQPVSPKKRAIVALSLLIGLALGVGLAFVKHALSGGVEDPELLERATGIGVHASIPHSGRQAALSRQANRAGGRLPLLAATDSKELSVEAVRSLRTSLQFALLESASNVVTVSGLAPGVGKSFVTVNLGHLLGEAGKRVAVVDADLRRGHLHRYVGQERSPGLTEVLRGDVPLQAALRTVDCAAVQVLTTGALPPNPAELLGSERFQRVLASLSEHFDVVLVDTPPILAVADAAVVARLAGVNLLVLKAGQHPLREIAAGLKQFGRNGARVHGIVLNDVSLSVGFGRKNAYHYQYRYE